MAKIKLPFVNSFYDRHGKRRHQFRRKGHQKKLLPGLPGTAEFMEAYHALLEKTGGGSLGIEVGASRTKAGTFNALIAKYYKDDAFAKGLAKATQDMRRPIINRFRETVSRNGMRYGDGRVA